MKRIICLLLIAPLILSLSSCSPRVPSEDIDALATQFVNQLAHGEFSAATKGFDRTMRSVMPSGELKKIWESITAEAGPFKEQLETRTDKYEQYDIIYVTSRFEYQILDIQVVFDDNKRISGLHFRPSSSDILYQAPDYVDTSAFNEREITLGKSPWALPGILTLPNGPGPFPTVILVHGSGPQDRDVTIGPNKPFKDLAWGLASNGIAVLRYDKRTLVHGTQMAATISEPTVQEETIDDALAAIEVLKQMPEVDQSRVYLLGHSLGGTLAPRIASSTNDLVGLIIMAGASRPLEDLYLEQMTYLLTLDGPMSVEKQAQLDKARQEVQLVKSPELSPTTPIEQLPLGVPANYWLDLRHYDPVTSATNFPGSILILQGERDYQVTMEDFQLWQSGLTQSERVSFISYPELNHIFMPGEGSPNPQEYSLKSTVSPQVITNITQWINR